LLSRLDEPRFRSWVQAGLALALPVVGLVVFQFVEPDWDVDLHLLYLAAAFPFLAGFAFSGLALLSSFAGLLALDAPRPAWRYVEPWLLGLPFLLLAALIVMVGVAQLIY
jgi:hypothetical protein